MSGLTISLLGPFGATSSGGQQLHFPTAKTRALLAYLLTEESMEPSRSHQREQLMTMFWPDILPKSAQTNLRQTLYRLRQTLPEQEIGPNQSAALLIGDRQSVRVNPMYDYTLDAALFERSLKEAEQASPGARMEALKAAIGLYRGDFLSDVYVPDSEPFENWAEQVRERLRREALSALEQVSSYAFDRGDFNEAEERARRLISIDNLNETGYRRLMLTLAAEGKRTEALSEFERLSELLEDELGIGPSRETIGVANIIRKENFKLKGDQPQESAVPADLPAQERSTASLDELRETIADELVTLISSRYKDSLLDQDFTESKPVSPPSNLPYELNRFVGRQKQIAEILDLFEQDKARLVTLTGPGGVGKTRLAIRLASELRGRFKDGVWLVELASLVNPDLIARQTMRVFSLREEEGQPLIQTLVEYLRSRKLLLILDNCEHLIEDAALFAHTILRSAPEVRILATSREPLAIEGEIMWALPPLSSPDPAEKVTPETLANYEAADLFIERVMAIQPQFIIDAENAKAIAQVCTCLDGIPLAIELAAARLKAMSVEDVAARLGDCFRFLVGNRTSEPRQKTLESLIDWSYDLLPQDQRMMMRCLSVFSGGWSLEAAESVCTSSVIDRSDVLELLAQLVDKSLVMAVMNKGGTRYRFLETIRQFAADRLVKSGEAPDVKMKHSQYYLDLAEKSYGKLWGKDQGLWLDRLEVEHDNLRRALEHISYNDPTGDSFLRMAGSLWRFWEVRGYITEGRSWISRALESSPGASTYFQANGHRGAGILARQQGDYDEAQSHHEISLALFRELGPDYNLGAARQLDALGEIEQYHGNYEAAIAYHKESLALQQEIGDKEGIAASLAHLGVIAREQGHYGESEELLKQSLQLNREQGDRLRIGVDLNNLGLLATLQCHYDQALHYLEEAVLQYRDLNNKLGISDSLMNMGDVAKDRGDFKQSDALYAECLTLKRELGERRGIARTMVRQATTALLQGNYRAAHDLADQSLASFTELGIKRGVLVALRISGLVAIYEGEFERADKLAQESLQMAQQLGALFETAQAEVVMGLSAHAQADLEEAEIRFGAALAEFRAINDRRSIAHTLVGMARSAYRRDDHAGAKKYLDESLALSRKYGIQWSLAYSLEIMGLLKRSEGDYRQASKLLLESLQLSYEQANRQGIANALGGIAGLAAMVNQPDLAMLLFASADRIREEIGGRMGLADKREYESCLRIAKEQMDEATFAACWAVGLGMSIDRAVQEAQVRLQI
ncbi:MAG: tetratricopeptide repeat protein [Candidatus Promineifilaceae bacterium]